VTIDEVGPVVPGGSRLLSLGQAYFGALSLGGDLDQGVRLSWGAAPTARWPADGVFAGERVVLHVVVDTGRADEAERARLYVGGVLRPPTPGFELGPGRIIQVAPDDELVLGNAADPYPGGRVPLLGHSPAGRISYAAVYSVALDDDEIAQNVAVLELDDDTP